MDGEATCIGSATLVLPNTPCAFLTIFSMKLGVNWSMPRIISGLVQFGSYGRHQCRYSKDIPSREENVQQSTQTTRSYAMAAQPKVGRDIDSATLPALGWHGEFPTIKLSKAEVQKGLDYYKFALVGRIDLRLLKFDRVRELVSQKWSTKGEALGFLTNRCCASTNGAQIFLSTNKLNLML
ncbi:hypothetical protein IFM89_031497 [Coptis chinensis]|uniref:Uncharacterized protein n=1 Tax=Coptis chinensis TaxID=261450 RepID=A0A835HG99_9MAGN|nr:hypothetical protein IFM89_031497 [Coptis chinensis]